MDKIWIEGSGANNSTKFGMSSALGAKKEDLPTNVRAGSLAFDYTTQNVYSFDGVSWN